MVLFELPQSLEILERAFLGLSGSIGVVLAPRLVGMANRISIKKEPMKAEGPAK